MLRSSVAGLRQNRPSAFGPSPLILMDALKARSPLWEDALFFELPFVFLKSCWIVKRPKVSVRELNIDIVNDGNQIQLD